jgi:hypothetical protein
MFLVNTFQMSISHEPKKRLKVESHENSRPSNGGAIVSNEPMPDGAIVSNEPHPQLKK